MKLKQNPVTATKEHVAKTEQLIRRTTAEIAKAQDHVAASQRKLVRAIKTLKRSQPGDK